MKSSQISALLRLEWVGILFLLVFSMANLGTVMGALSSWDGMLGLRSNRVDSFMAFPIAIGAILIFPTPVAWRSNTSFQTPSLEFLFSQPFSRARVFWMKSGVYLLGCLLAPALLCAYTVSDPVVRLSAPYQAESRAEMKSFYLENFSDAQVEKTKEGEKIVLPRGKITQSIFGFLMVWGFLLLVQVAAVFTVEKKWGYITVWAVMLMWQFGFGELFFPAMSTPSRYEIAVAWVANHSLLVMVLGALLTIGVELICVRRFCRTEVF